jgi:hypothetical protein
MRKAAASPLHSKGTYEAHVLGDFEATLEPA